MRYTVSLSDSTLRGLPVAVKTIRSAERVFAALEMLAEHEPIGVGALARLLDEDKSAVQRALVTLARTGWIRAVPGEPTRWELTSRVLVVAEHVHRRSGLRQLARPTLETLRQQTGESVILAVAEADRVVIVDVAESSQLVRTAPHVGLIVPAETSASGRAILAALDDAGREALLGRPVTRSLAAELEVVRARGWSLNADDVARGATSVGAAVLDDSGRPVGAVAVSAVSARMPQEVQEQTGELLAQTLRTLSLNP